MGASCSVKSSAEIANTDRCYFFVSFFLIRYYATFQLRHILTIGIQDRDSRITLSSNLLGNFVYVNAVCDILDLWARVGLSAMLLYTYPVSVFVSTQWREMAILYLQVGKSIFKAWATEIIAMKLTFGCFIYICLFHQWRVFTSLSLTSGWLIKAITLAEHISEDKEDMMAEEASVWLTTNWLLALTEGST